MLDLGPLYRIVMYGAAFIFKFVTRFICVETVLAILPRKNLDAIKSTSATTTTVQMKKKSKKIQ